MAPKKLSEELKDVRDDLVEETRYNRSSQVIRLDELILKLKEEHGK